MKLNRLFALSLAAVMLCTGCSNNAKPAGKPVDAAAAYDTLTAELAKWDGSQNVSTLVSGNIFTEYNKLPSAVAFTGQYMQQAASAGNEIFAAMNFDYGDGYYYATNFLSNGTEFATSVESGSTDPAATEEPIYIGEYVDAETFRSGVSFGLPVLAFDEGLVTSAATEDDKEHGYTLVTFQLDADRCENAVITLLEHLQYIDTEVVPVTADVSSMSCTADYDGETLVNLTYKFSADLTAEGEVMKMDYFFTHSLNKNGEDVKFGLPNLENIVTDNTATEDLTVIE